MGWSGGTFTRTNGTYTGSGVWDSDETNGFDITSARHDTHDQDLATGINSCLNKDGSNTPSTNLSWVHTTHNLGTLSGSSNAYTKTNSPTVSAYAAGQWFTALPNHDNTGAATINLDSIGAKNIKVKAGGALYDTPPGALRNGQLAVLYYDGTQFLLQGYNVLDRINSQTDVTNTTTETALYSKSILGDTLGAYNGLRLSANLDLQQNAGSPPNLVIRVDYGASEIYSATISSLASTGSNRHAGRIEVELQANASDAQQRSFTELKFYNDPSNAGGAQTTGNDVIGPYQIYGASDTSSEDSTAAKTLQVTAQWSAASTNFSVRLNNAVLEYI